MMLQKVISGAQDGVDIAGLRAAKACEIPTGGFMTKNFMTNRGSKPEYKKEYNIEPTIAETYPERTKLNIAYSDATLVFATYWNSPETALTLRLLNRLDKPFMCVHVDLSDKFTPTVPAVVTWIMKNNIKVLNIAGNSRQELEEPVQEYLEKVFNLLKEKTNAL